MFPALWRVRDHDTNVVVVGPFVHREAPHENDNWLAPFYFSGSRPDGGYFHSLPLLTYSQWSKDSALTIVGPYFRTRSGTDTMLGAVPFVFHGNNGNVEGNSRVYTFIPPLLFYHATHELDGSNITVVGPVIAEDSPKRSVFDAHRRFHFHWRGQARDGRRRRGAHDLLPVLPLRARPGAIALHLAGVLPAGDEDRRHAPQPVLFRISRGGAAPRPSRRWAPILPLYWKYTEPGPRHPHTLATVPFFYTSDQPDQGTTG